MGVRNSIFFTASVLNCIGVTLYAYYTYTYQLGVLRLWSQVIQCVPRKYKYYYPTIDLKIINYYYH